MILGHTHYRIFLLNDIQWVYLQAAAGFFVLLLVLLRPSHGSELYLFIGFCVVLLSKIWCTSDGSWCVGKLLAFPARRKIKIGDFVRKLKLSLTKFENVNGADSKVVLGKKNRFQLTHIAKSVKSNPASKYRKFLSDFTVISDANICIVLASIIVR
jgi:hypothetical protein